MKRHMLHRHRGFTLTELLVVMVIIGLLSTIIVPVYISRMEDARIRVARAECREIAQAEEQCAILHGFYVPFQVLDDMPKRTGSPAGDYIDREPDSIKVVDPMIRPDIQRLRAGGQFSFAMRDTNTRIGNLINHWSGPFITPQRVYDVPGGYSVGNPAWETSSEARLDFPIDPWGEPYRFYSPEGIIGAQALVTGSTTGYNTDTYFDGQLTTLGDRNFPRYAVVSFGKDNLPDVSSGGALSTNLDDIVYLFGTPGVESDFGLRN